ncbi:hypothetical protein CPB85DRAFT_1258736 [Mucidula mucida]|nr:hypothetical protein CPB85DRAFT_1258736 [Mucidula mucida]
MADFDEYFADYAQDYQKGLVRRPFPSIITDAGRLQMQRQFKAAETDDETPTPPIKSGPTSLDQRAVYERKHRAERNAKKREERALKCAQRDSTMHEEDREIDNRCASRWQFDTMQMPHLRSHWLDTTIMHLVNRIIAGRAVSPKTTSPAPPSGEATPAPARSSSTPVLKPVYPVTAEMKAKSAALNVLTPSNWKMVPLPPGPKSPSSHSPRPPRSPKSGFQQRARPSPVDPDREIFNRIPTPHNCTEFLKWEAQIAEANKAKRSMQEPASEEAVGEAASEVAPSQSSAGVLPILKPALPINGPISPVCTHCKDVPSIQIDLTSEDSDEDSPGGEPVSSGGVTSTDGNVDSAPSEVAKGKRKAEEPIDEERQTPEPPLFRLPSTSPGANNGWDAWHCQTGWGYGSLYAWKPLFTDCKEAEEVYWIVLHGTKPGIFHGRLKCLSANPTSTPAAWAFTMGEAAIIFTKNYMDGVIDKSG